MLPTVSSASADQSKEVDRRVDEAMSRVGALELCRELLPKDFDDHSKTVKDIYVAAAGDEIKKGSEQHEEYLRGGWRASWNVAPAPSNCAPSAFADLPAGIRA